MEVYLETYMYFLDQDFIKVTTELDNPFIKYLKSVQSNLVPTSQN